MAENVWKKAEMSKGREPEIPVTGQSVVLYYVSRVNPLDTGSDIGSLAFDDEASEAYWNSAFGFNGIFDGLFFRYLLKWYDIYFADAPPLKNGRFPPSMPIGNGV